MRKYLIGAAAVLFPALLLYPSGEGFYLDWHNHVWLVGFFGENFHRHGFMPQALVTREYAGLTQPIFYGYLFYPLLGLASAWLHQEIVVRVAALLIFAAEYVCVRKTLRRLGATDGLAATVACLMIWAIYGLTNLYNRSALTEFFAVGLLTCAVCTWFDMLTATAWSAVWRRGLRFGLLLTLAAGSHPITALYSLPLLALLAVCSLQRPAGPGRLARLAALVVAALLGVAALAPWAWAVHLLGQDIFIASYTNQVTDMTTTIDHWATRLFPLPFDRRTFHDRPADVSTAFLDASINLPLLVLGLALLWPYFRGLDRRHRLGAGLFVALPLLYAALHLWLSLTPQVFEHLPRVFLVVQFLYRLVTYVNLGLFLVPVFLLFYARSHRLVLHPAGGALVSPVLLCFVLTLAGSGVALKLLHASCASIPETAHVQRWAVFGRKYTHHVGEPHLRRTDADREALIHLPLTFCSYADYTTPNRFPPLAPAEEATVRYIPLAVECQGKRFGECRAVTVHLDAPGYVSTQVAAFPWNRFFIDSQPIGEKLLRSWQPESLAPWNAAARLVIPMPAGTHVLEYRFVPDPAWRRLHRCAWLILTGWITVVSVWTAVPFVRRRRRVPGAAPPIEGLREAA